MGDIGSGKSTLAKLILGLYPIESGDILFDGKSIFKQPIESIRAQIGYVPQKAYLFTGSIAMNLAYGKAQDSDASLSEGELTEAAVLAGAHEFISRFDDGYDHPLPRRHQPIRRPAAKAGHGPGLSEKAPVTHL